MVKVLDLRSKMLSGILLTKLHPQPNLIKMPHTSQESHQETKVMLLQVTNISLLNKWVSLKCKVHHQLMLGDLQCMKLEKRDNKLRNQFSIGTLTETVLDLRRKISLRILQETQLLQLNSIKMPLISQVFMLVTKVNLRQPQGTSMVIKLELLSCKLMAHQLLKDNMHGENPYTLLEEWDNHSQMSNPKRELVLQSSNNGLMEMDLVLRKKISSRILRETQTVILLNSIKTPLTSQVLLLTLGTIPLQLMNISVDLKLPETEAFQFFRVKYIQ